MPGAPTSPTPEQHELSADAARSVDAAAVHGFVVVPYRIVFDAPGIGRWLKSGWPLLWQTWSDITDFSRISFATRLEILRYRYNHLYTTMWMPGHWRAVRWWLGRLMARDQWAWDGDLVASHVTHDGHTLDSLRRPLREFLYPEGLVNLLAKYPALHDVEDGYVYVPPTTTYHIRLKTLPAVHPGWIGYGDELRRDYLAQAHAPRGESLARHGAGQTGLRPTESSVAVVWRDVRLHQFRFGDGFVSLAFDLDTDALQDAPLASALERLRLWSRRPELLELGFAPGRRRRPDGAPAAPLPWEPPPAMGLGTLMQHLLTPSQLDEEEPELDQWAFLWDEPPTTLRNRHRIEFPLAKQLPMLLMPTANVSANTTSVDAATTPAPQLEQVEQVVEDLHVCTGVLSEDEPSPTPTGEVADTDADNSNADKSSAEASEVELEGPSALTQTSEQQQQTSRVHALNVFLLALLRRVKLGQIGDALAMPRGQSGLNTAQQLQMVAFELSVARDRFLSGPPVLGGRLARLWERIEQDWQSLKLEERLTTVVDSYRDNYFRDRSLRLIARATSTFWFLFRWVILSLLIVQFLVIAVTGLILGFAAVLTLSVFITLILFGAWVTRQIMRESDDDEAELDETAPRAPPHMEKESRKKQFWRKWWIPIVALVEVVVLTVLLIFWPDLREMMLPYLRRFALGTAVVLGLFFFALLVLFAVSPKLRRGHKRILSWLKREAFPVLGLGFIALVLFALLIWVWAFLDRVGFDQLRFPRFWGDVVEGPAEPGEEQP